MQHPQKTADMKAPEIKQKETYAFPAQNGLQAFICEADDIHDANAQYNAHAQKEI